MSSRRSLLAAAAVLFATVVAAGCGSTGTSEPVATTKVSMAKSYHFDPKAIEIKAGDTVTWTNNDNFTHTVKVDGQEDHKVGRGDSVSIEELGPAFAAGREQNRSLEYIEVLHDSRAINERFIELQIGIRREIFVFTKAVPHPLVVPHGGDARCVYELAVVGDREIAEHVSRFEDRGETTRFFDELPLDLVIIDESIVMFGMEDPVAGRTEKTMMVSNIHLLQASSRSLSRRSGTRD